MFSILIKAELIVSGFTHMDMELEARIWASRLGLRSQDWDLGLKTGIWASRLGLEGGVQRRRRRRGRRRKFPICLKA